MTDPSDKSWNCFERFVLRATGMPFEWLLKRGDESLWDMDADGYRRALEASRVALWELVENPLFREAVFMSSPQVHGLLDGWKEGVDLDKRPRKERKRERTLYRFLTRFTAKNDTTSFFGATSIGHLDHTREDVLELPIAEVRRAFLEHWAAETFLTAAADELGVQSPAEGIPVGHPRVFEYLEGWLRSQPVGDTQVCWIERLSSLRDRFAAFERAAYVDRIGIFQSVEEDFQAWTAAAARRGEGAYYSSKTVLHEVGDRSGQVVGLTSNEKASLTSDMSPVMDFCTLQVLVERMKTYAYVHNHIADSDVSFTELTQLLKSAGPDYHLGAPPEARRLYRELQEIREHMRGRIERHIDTGTSAPMELLDGSVHSLLERWQSELSASGRAYTNPDILLGGGDGASSVLGDMHAMPFLTPAAFAAAPSETEVWETTRSFLADLCAPEKPAFLTHRRPSFVAYVPDLGEVALELDGVASVPDGRRAAFESLMVRVKEGGFHYRATTHDGVEMTVMPLTRAANTFSRYSSALQRTARVYPVKLLDIGRWLAAPGWRSIGQLPRLLFNGVVVHRRTWEVSAAEWIAKNGDPHTSLRNLGELTDRSLPRFCYVKGEGDPKPLLVDFADPISAELFLWMARNQTSVELTEMLPGPESLWLRGPDGRHTSELRCVYSR